MTRTPVTESGTVIDRIVAQTRTDLETRKRQVPRAALLERITRQPSPVGFEQSLRRDHVAVIAEFKRASPSRGRFPVEINPAAVTADYIEGGAAAISCLTDGPFFHGSLDDLESVVARVTEMGAEPGVLRKDFMVDPYQIDEARAYGASCILLIAAVLDDASLRELSGYASHLGLATLVEVHDERELERALATEATLIGINNRNLKTLEVDLGVTERLAARVPVGVTLVGESGISSIQDVGRMARAGVHAVLIGESLIVHSDRVAALAKLSSVERRPRYHD